MFERLMNKLDMVPTIMKHTTQIINKETKEHRQTRVYTHTHTHLWPSEKFSDVF